MLKRELLAEGVSVPRVMVYKDDIINYLKSLVEEGLPSDIAGSRIGTIYEPLNEIGEDTSTHVTQSLDAPTLVSLPLQYKNLVLGSTIEPNSTRSREVFTTAYLPPSLDWTSHSSSPSFQRPIYTSRFSPALEMVRH